jgi:hypothetical protein
MSGLVSTTSAGVSAPGLVETDIETGPRWVRYEPIREHLACDCAVAPDLLLNRVVGECGPNVHRRPYATRSTADLRIRKW